MTKFYKISTTDFQPISFRNVYLYGEYNKIKNFLASNNQQELLKVLAIPSYKNNNIEWSANANNEVKKLDQYTQNQQNKILSQYNEFLNSYNSFVNKLKLSKNQDNKNWGELLFSLIEGTANELFFDGEDIFITWGWRLLDENSKKLIPVYSPQPSIVGDVTPIIEEEEKDEPETIPVIDEYEEIPLEEEEEEEEEERKLSWLDKLYLFLKRLWWLVPLLSLLILILLLFGCDCNEAVLKGCIDKEYKEYNPNANVDDGSCRTILIPCNTDTKSGSDGITTTTHSLGQQSGTVTISYDMKHITDKLEVFYENKRVCSTFDVTGNQNGFVGGANKAGDIGKISFDYQATGDSFCKIIVTGGVDSEYSTEWTYTLGCPK